ncbi:MAG: arginine--tRNA ligase [Candidatus Delongbacteria bacterium]|jgi:arginyl-tRNA synthetase|nr:arginine--tRNA ligase [Candidatus Delongbacteria bacterium]
MNIFKLQAAKILSTNYPDLSQNLILDSFELPKNSEFGDMALPCFKFAKALRKSPIQIADDFISLFHGNELYESITNIKGYLNFKFSKTIYIKSVLDNYTNENIFAELSLFGKNKTMVIDYSHPNVAKNMGIHNLRSTIIGQSLYNIFESLGYKAIGVNHLGDWGTQFGKLMWALEKWSSIEEVEEKGILFLNENYVRFHKEAEKNPSMEDEARKWFKKLEDNDLDAVKWWKLFIKISMESYKKIYKRLDVSFDFVTGESFYIQFLAETIAKLETANLTEISEGALVVKFDESDNMPPCLLKKSDGATLYGTRDVAAVMYRLKVFNPDVILYITDIAQQLHFNQVFNIIEKYNPSSKGKLEHIIFGRLSFPDGQMSTRKGNIIPLNEVLDKARDKVLEILDEREVEVPDKYETAEKIGIGAVIFNDLSRGRIKNIEFDWDQILSFEGETGPHIQYSYVRMHNILERVKCSDTSEIDFSALTDEYSYELIKTLEQFSKKVIQAHDDREPSVIAHYLIELAKNFNRFYRNNRIIDAPKDVQDSRIHLVKILISVYGKCMNLLGLPIVEKM